MTVEQLIEALAKMPLDAEVMVEDSLNSDSQKPVYGAELDDGAAWILF